MTALASGATTPTRVPDIGEAVTAYTKDDYILNFSAIKFSAKHGVWDGYFDRKAQENARWVEIDRDSEAKRIARSIEARRAKQAARKAAKVEGGEHGAA